MAMALLWSLVFLHVGYSAVTAVTYSCLSNATCGCSLNSAVLTKIVGGEQAGADTWGWAVSIRVDNSHICGGSLISSTLVLTAAHCMTSLRSISSVSTVVGSRYLSQIRQQRSISTIYIHHDYKSSTFLNDIAVLRLSTAIDMTDRSVALICLPSMKSTEYPPTGASVVAIGWGVLSSGAKAPPNPLQQVTLQIFSSAITKCRGSVNNANVQICAGVDGGGKDTCQGDSGGPLMIFSDSKWILAGLTSYGTGCALADYPGVYTRIAYYIDWISCFLTNDTTCIAKISFKQTSFSSAESLIISKDILIFFLFLLILNSFH